MSAVKSEYYQSKVKTVDEIIKMGESSSVIGVVSLEGISSKALQGIRISLRKGSTAARIKVAKNNMKLRALQNLAENSSVHKKIVDLLPHVQGSCALIFTESDPFKLQKFLNRNQVPAPAKAGQTSTVDVFVPAGTTNLDPGPVISEFGILGIDTKIEKGKIKINKDTKVLSPGDKVTETHASVLNRLGIQPFKIGLKIDAIFEHGDIILGQSLDIDDEKILSDLVIAYNQSISLATSSEVTYYTKETIEILLRKGNQKAISLAIESEFISKDTIEALIQTATSKAKAIETVVKN